MEAKFLFQFAFCAVSLAIVWGSTLERIKYCAYVIYAIVFASIIYPIGSHWVFGGGWLQNGETALLPTGMQDFAGSTAVHLIGATGALAALLLLGPRKGKYGPDGKPRVIPGHSMPLVGLGIIILFFGWFGFNPGSTLGATDGRLAEVAVVTLLGAAGGVIGAFAASQLKLKTIDIGMVGNGMIAGLVAITAPSGYVEAWAGPADRLHRRPDRGVRRDRDRQEASTTRSGPCPRTAWRASGARSRAACSPRRGSPSTTPSAIPTAACSTRASSTQLIAQAVGLADHLRVRVRPELRSRSRSSRRRSGCG